LYLSEALWSFVCTSASGRALIGSSVAGTCVSHWLIRRRWELGEGVLVMVEHSARVQEKIGGEH
jgi:hypothetical protein